MSEDEPDIASFGHGLGRKRVAPDETPKPPVRVQPEGIAKYGHGLGPRPVTRLSLDQALFGLPEPLSSGQKRTLAIALVALGSVSIGAFAIIQAIDRRNCEADPNRRGSCDHWTSSRSGSGGGGYGGGGAGHSASFGGFGGSSGFYGGGS